MPVLPTTVGVTALRDAACQYFGSDAVEIANLQYREAMVLPETGGRIVQSIRTPLGNSAAKFRFAGIGTNPAAMWRSHFVGRPRIPAQPRHGSTAAPPSSPYHH